MTQEHNIPHQSEHSEIVDTLTEENLRANKYISPIEDPLEYPGRRPPWMKYGALQYFECRGADFETVEMGGDKARTFPEMTGAKPDENVWFSFIVYESKEEKERITELVNQEMGEKYAETTDFVMPFDPNRMAQGGFVVEVEG